MFTVHIQNEFVAFITTKWGEEAAEDMMTQGPRARH